MKEKFVVITSLAFSDVQDTKRLSEFASKGLMLKGFRVPMLSYRLISQEKENVDFLIDFSKASNQGYFDSYSQNGWDHVFSSNDLHYFKAIKGTTPYYSDIEGKVQLYKKVSKRYGIYALLSLVPLLLFGYLLSMQTTNELVNLLLFALTGFSIMAFVICIMPLITYYFRAKRLYNNA